MSRSVPLAPRRGLCALTVVVWLLGGCAALDTAQTPAKPAPPAATRKAAPPPAARATSKPAPSAVPFSSAQEALAAVTRLLPAYVDERDGWAADIQAAFTALRLPQTLENYCATIAVIEQESSFQADPVVPGLPRIAWREIEARRDRYGIPQVVLDTALAMESPDGRSYRNRINALKTERELSTLYEDMVSELPASKTLLDGHNPVRTGGPMQIGIDFAEALVRAKGYPYPRQGRSLRDELFTRRGGLYFGIAALLDYPAPYTEPLYRFADYNAGRYSSRNAAFQQVAARLSGRPLRADGDLLRYRNGAPAEEDSETLRALLTLNDRLRLSREELLRDLRLEKTPFFVQTPLYLNLYALNEAALGSPPLREALPQIDIASPKFRRRFSTEIYARRVDLRYRACLARRPRSG